MFYTSLGTFPELCSLSRRRRRRCRSHPNSRLPSPLFLHLRAEDNTAKRASAAAHYSALFGALASFHHLYRRLVFTRFPSTPSFPPRSSLLRRSSPYTPSGLFSIDMGHFHSASVRGLAWREGAGSPCVLGHWALGENSVWWCS